MRVERISAEFLRESLATLRQAIIALEAEVPKGDVAHISIMQYLDGIAGTSEADAEKLSLEEDDFLRLIISNMSGNPDPEAKLALIKRYYSGEDHRNHFLFKLAGLLIRARDNFREMAPGDPYLSILDATPDKTVRTPMSRLSPARIESVATTVRGGAAEAQEQKGEDLGQREIELKLISRSGP